MHTSFSVKKSKALRGDNFFMDSRSCSSPDFCHEMLPIQCFQIGKDINHILFSFFIRHYNSQ